MSDRPDADFEQCLECGKLIPLSEVKFPTTEDAEEDDDVDMNTQFGWLAGQCPNCGADLRLAYDRLRNLFIPPN